MLKHMVVVGAFLVSVAAFASTPDFSVFNVPQQGGPGAHGGASCIHAAWDAAKPTADQNQQAQSFMADAKTIVDQHKDAVMQDFKAIGAAWAQYPVNEDDVVQAETALQGEMAPVMGAVQDAQIKVLNLLSQAQRTTFDSAMKSCFQQGHHHHPHH